MMTLETRRHHWPPDLLVHVETATAYAVCKSWHMSDEVIEIIDDQEAMSGLLCIATLQA